MNGKEFLILLMLSLIALSISAQAGAKPRPPRSLRYISENIRTLEESHDEGEYDEALESIEKIREDLSGISSEINAAGSGNLLTALMGYLGDYEEGLRQKRADSEDYEEARIEISMTLFEIMDSFSYRTPPLLDFIERQLDELKEEVLEEGEWDGAEDELEEIEEFLNRLIDSHSGVAGVGSLGGEMEEKMEDLENAIERENANRVLIAVQDMETLLKELSGLISD